MFLNLWYAVDIKSHKAMSMLFTQYRNWFNQAEEALFIYSLCLISSLGIQIETPPSPLLQICPQLQAEYFFFSFSRQTFFIKCPSWVRSVHSEKRSLGHFGYYSFLTNSQLCICLYEEYHSKQAARRKWKFVLFFFKKKSANIYTFVGRCCIPIRTPIQARNKRQIFTTFLCLQLKKKRTKPNICF